MYISNEPKVLKTPLASSMLITNHQLLTVDGTILFKVEKKLCFTVSYKLHYLKKTNRLNIFFIYVEDIA